jgi:hypothetical protein
VRLQRHTADSQSGLHAGFRIAHYVILRIDVTRFGAWDALLVADCPGIDPAPIRKPEVKVAAVALTMFTGSLSKLLSI